METTRAHDGNRSATERARALLRQGRIPEASGILEEHLARRPDDPEALLVLATARLLDSDTEEFALLLQAATETLARTRDVPSRIAALWRRCLALAKRAGLAVAFAAAVAGCSKQSGDEPAAKGSRPAEVQGAGGSKAPVRQARGRPTGETTDATAVPRPRGRARPPGPAAARPQPGTRTAREAAYPDPKELSTGRLRALTRQLDQKVRETAGQDSAPYRAKLDAYRAELARRKAEASARGGAARPSRHHPRHPMSRHRYSAGVIPPHGFGKRSPGAKGKDTIDL